jgi:putative ABC transport system substrate-binding protein
MQRRQFITLLGGAAAAWPLAARAQQPAMPVIGVLYGTSAAEWEQPMAGFRRGLAEAGFVEGRNVAVEYRWAEGQYERMRAMAADLIGRKVAVILVGGSLPGVRATAAATQTIPIVFTTNTDPVAQGIVASLNRPSGNVTGVTGLGSELVPKRLELMHEIIPTATKFAVLVNPNNQAAMQDALRGAQEASRRLGLEFVTLNAGPQRSRNLIPSFGSCPSAFAFGLSAPGLPSSTSGSHPISSAARDPSKRHWCELRGRGLPK